MGLGLAIAKHLVEAHGGSISAENAPDGGTIIRLSLPVIAYKNPIGVNIASTLNNLILNYSMQ
ncbi:MAG: hypothetical protein A2136_11130 [Chloroflexi bacterium RBG_16_54_11]|nr:MAG: hypothetical protein A2136_11130 [Chloroflexi bacterium RBG_16_54_11]